ncbi:MAG: bifunctional 3-(3-hydroxy-phenyl)propionate/3-hydroxycinnamic acid hydroxylase [Microbacteriaceae bacterium]|nr:bifunctional 3-(3-hydroxy-phenyl)propionate/3-hydroxycinnamic acid hydroxylase [Microbacteriaceae bacterium]
MAPNRRRTPPAPQPRPSPRATAAGCRRADRGGRAAAVPARRRGRRARASPPHSPSLERPALRSPAASPSIRRHARLTGAAAAPHAECDRARRCAAAAPQSKEPAVSPTRPHPAAATEVDTDVVIVGAGPTGLMLANLLGRRGGSAIVLESRDALIDYPRAVGLDDEGLRTMQTAGLIDAVLPHTTPSHAMRMVNGRGRVMAEMRPSTDEFGWSRRNAFVQPLVDAALAEGLERYPGVELRFGAEATGFVDRGDHVETTVAAAEGEHRIRSRFLVGADGGRSSIRKALGIGFPGISPSTRWLVVDIADDPVGTPNVFLGADPRRPYASIGLPHGIRRFEFMLFDDESDEFVDTDEFALRALSAHVRDPLACRVIRRRVYTHHSRVATTFRKGRTLLVGDAAHLMPVWQGQGYNSGLRDATNLAWKLTAVLRGQAGTELLDSYTAERREHAKAMVDLSTNFGRFIAQTNPVASAARDAVAGALGALPAVKRWFVEMKYKPMPRYTRGAVVDATDRIAGRSRPRLTGALAPIRSANSDVSPVGTQFIQPDAALPDGSVRKLDDIIGDWWAVVLWQLAPEQVLDAERIGRLRALGARFIVVRPMTQLGNPGSAVPEAQVVGDVTGRLKRWFDERPTPVVLLRPDRFVAAASLVQDAPAAFDALLRAASVPPGFFASADAPPVPAAADCGDGAELRVRR